MTHTRRKFFSGASAVMAGVGCGALFASPAIATLNIGKVRIDTVSDGYLDLPGDFIFAPMPQNELAPLLQNMNIPRDRVQPECNVTLLRDGKNTILFDVGSGQGFMPSAGKILATLAALDVAPEDVTHVVFTHGHPDHLWGLLDDFDDPLFSEATYLMGKKEWDYWLNPNTVDAIGASRSVFAVGARRRLLMIEGNINLFGDGEEILAGVAARASFGHTPGHMSFEVRSGSESVMIAGDAIGNHHVAFARPQWLSGSDQDGETAVKSRLGLLDQIASEQMKLVGFHLPDGGMGRAEKTSDGYRFIGEAS
ncbi:MBL fold metallo-hydrolase [Candidatus Halocynthiibacter alkanivorans]|uniref:MBL fold metallo-hydrolase n=1 Tax=Candidatus Halocynthiibacter alkanivorans TaxID=2267619 RepID=UPI000DF27AA6|nr:MBL fold metallo-hydrolase [Candidatus Halocynthiibacter alkanivorans]